MRGAGGSGGKLKLRISIRIIKHLTSVSDISPTAKAIYVTAMMNKTPCIQTLAETMKVDRRVVARHCKELRQRGWMRMIDNGNALRPAAIIPSEVEAVLATEIKEMIDLSPFKGEETAKAFVDWIVAPSVRLLFNARPPFLKSEDTGENLEYDIWADEYGWAREYHGDQHFGPTKRFQGDREFVERFRRDQMKLKLSKKNNIQLTIVTKRDLTLLRTLEEISSVIPRREFDPRGPYVKMLEMIGKEIAGAPDWDRQ